MPGPGARDWESGLGTKNRALGRRNQGLGSREQRAVHATLADDGQRPWRAGPEKANAFAPAGCSLSPGPLSLIPSPSP